MTQENNKEWRECPICGVELVLASYDAYWIHPAIFENPKCVLQDLEIADTEENRVIWNTRKRQDELRERLRKCNWNYDALSSEYREVAELYGYKDSYIEKVLKPFDPPKQEEEGNE